MTSNCGNQTGQVGKVLGDKWKALKLEDRKPYEDQAREDKARYESEKLAYQNVRHLHTRHRDQADIKQRDEDEEESS